MVDDCFINDSFSCDFYVCLHDVYLLMCIGAVCVMGAGSLVLWAQQVVDRLDGIERRQGHLHHQRVPVAHCSVPQAWQFEGLQFPAVLALVGYESRAGVDVLCQVELPTLVVLGGAYYVHGVEVRTVFEHLHVFLAIPVYLAAFQNLE